MKEIGHIIIFFFFVSGATNTGGLFGNKATTGGFGTTNTLGGFGASNTMGSSLGGGNNLFAGNNQKPGGLALGSNFGTGTCKCRNWIY